MSSAQDVIIVIPSPRDEDGFVRCYEHGEKARIEFNHNCDHAVEQSRLVPIIDGRVFAKLIDLTTYSCLRCAYFVCSKPFDDLDRCDFFC